MNEGAIEEDTHNPTGERGMRNYTNEWEDEPQGDMWNYFPLEKSNEEKKDLTQWEMYVKRGKPWGQIWGRLKGRNKLVGHKW